MAPQDPISSMSSATIPFLNVARPVGITAPMNVVVPSVAESGFIPLTPELFRTGNITIHEDAPMEIQATVQNGVQNPILGALLSNGNGQHRNDQSDGPLRLLCQGRELTMDLDEKSVLEIGLRDNSIIHVQSGGGHGTVKVGHHGTLTHGIRDHSPGQIGGPRDKIIQGAAPPDPASMPMALLSTPNNWKLLMDLIKLLIEKSSTVRENFSGDCVAKNFSFLGNSGFGNEMSHVELPSLGTYSAFANVSALRGRISSRIGHGSGRVVVRNRSGFEIALGTTFR